VIAINNCHHFKKVFVAITLMLPASCADIEQMCRIGLKKKITLILLASWMAGSAFAQEANWLTSFPAAADQASNEHKLILLNFTGSDWCGWCMKLDAETFSKPEFIDYASKNLVLVRVDFPMHKTLPDELKAANHALKEKYAVRGYPSVFIVKPDGTTLWSQTGYAPGGAPAMIDTANRCRKTVGLPVSPQSPPVVATAPVRTPAPVAVVPYQQPVPPPQKQYDQPTLQGILYSASHSSAVLDGKVCEVGDTVHGMHVLKIARDTVTVEFQGQTKLLTIN
jgi:thioredoxin-related protein